MSSELGQISEPTTADLRRELRRKRILETAKSRLEKLNGKAQGLGADPIGKNYLYFFVAVTIYLTISNELYMHIISDTTPTEVLEYSDPEVEPNILVDNASLEDIAFKNPFSSPTNTSAVNSDLTNLLVRSRIHIFIASLLGYILSQYVYISLFVPVGLCLLIEIFFYKSFQHGNGSGNLIVPITILFTGAQFANKIRQLNYFLSISQYLGISLGVNVFCICVSSISFQYFNANHVVTIN